LFDFEHLYLKIILKNSIENPKNSMKVMIEAPSARPSQPPTDAEIKQKHKNLNLRSITTA
jgi:hypothetical protein